MEWNIISILKDRLNVVVCDFSIIVLLKTVYIMIKVGFYYVVRNKYWRNSYLIACVLR